jgi:hypothetical protein
MRSLWPGIDAAHGRKRVPLRFPLALHPHDVVADFVVTLIGPISNCSCSTGAAEEFLLPFRYDRPTGKDPGPYIAITQSLFPRRLTAPSAIVGLSVLPVMSGLTGLLVVAFAERVRST